MNLDRVLEKVFNDLKRPLIFQVRQYFEKRKEVISVSLIDEKKGKSIASFRVVLSLRTGKKVSQGIKIQPLGYDLGLSFDYFNSVFDSWDDYSDVLEGGVISEF